MTHSRRIGRGFFDRIKQAAQIIQQVVPAPLLDAAKEAAIKAAKAKIGLGLRKIARRKRKGGTTVQFRARLRPYEK